jgi:hypothetical protein
MPDISQNKSVATTYPPEQLYESWREHADSLDLAISQYIIRMVEAGRKQVDLRKSTSDLSRQTQRQQSELNKATSCQRVREPKEDSSVLSGIQATKLNWEPTWERCLDFAVERFFQSRRELHDRSK